MPGIVLELGHTAVTKTVKTPVLMELMFKWKEVSSQQQVGKIQLSMLDGECSRVTEGREGAEGVAVLSRVRGRPC